MKSRSQFRWHAAADHAPGSRAVEGGGSDSTQHGGHAVAGGCPGRCRNRTDAVPARARKTVRGALAEACGKAAALLEGTQVKLQLTKNLSWTPAKQFSLTGTNGASRSIQIQLLFTTDWPQCSATAESAAPASQTARGIDVPMLENVGIDVVQRFGGRRLCPARDR